MTPLLAHRQARPAGAAYLVIIALGLFAQLVRDGLTVDGDPAATARRILEHESLFRAGFAAGVVVVILNAFVVVLLFELFRTIDGTLAALMAFFGVVATAIEGANLVNNLAPVVLLDDGPRFAAEAYHALQIQALGYGISLAVFGFFCLVAGFLIVRSGFLPRALGALLALGGGCYLVNSFAMFLAPGLASRLFPLVLLPCFLAEASLAVWLVTVGVKPPRPQSAGRPGSPNLVGSG